MFLDFAVGLVGTRGTFFTVGKRYGTASIELCRCVFCLAYSSRSAIASGRKSNGAPKGLLTSMDDVFNPRACT
eukprot:665796-Prorocentrum_minimum.AAC.1